MFSLIIFDFTPPYSLLCWKFWRVQKCLDIKGLSTFPKVIQIESCIWGAYDFMSHDQTSHCLTKCNDVFHYIMLWLYSPIIVRVTKHEDEAVMITGENLVTPNVYHTYPLTCTILIMWHFNKETKKGRWFWAKNTMEGNVCHWMHAYLALGSVL